MRVLRRFCCLLALSAFPVLAGAQLPAIEGSLPPVTLPGTQLPGEIVPDATDNLDRTLRRLTQARVTTIDRLVRENRAGLDRDPAGELVVRAEVVAIDITAKALERALAEKFLVRRTQKLEDLGVEITVLQTPGNWTAKRGLARLRKLDPEGVYDYNHVYLQSGTASEETRPATAAHPAAGSGRVGMIDGGVDDQHEVFRNVHFRHFGCDDQRLPGTHGTGVAAILATHATEIFSADVYCGKPTGGAVDGMAAALAWLARERIAVINVSLVGPRNALLERVVSSLVSRGFLIVAAVGNDGPAAPPLYPASYPGVIGVTAVDARHRVLVEACRGQQVDFSARGSEIQAASQAPAAYTSVRGTSFAAPVIAALMAPDLQSPDAAGRDAVLEKWSRAAVDLGKKGRDDVYGLGELSDAAAVLAEKANK
jgi:subtilisin family serine protease